MLKRIVSGIMLILLSIGISMLAFKIQPVESEPTTIIVPDDYPTIQEAINSANDNDTIFVKNGTYPEHVVVDKKVSLIGENRDATIIDGNGNGTVVFLSATSNITGFTIRNGEYGVRVEIFTMSPTFTGHRIEGNRIEDNRYGAINLRGCAKNTIANNIIVNSTLFGIHLWHAGNNMIINNTVVNNGHGIDFYGNSNDNILRNNNMTDNEYNFGLILREETRSWLYGSPSKPGIVNDVDPSNTVNGKPIYYLVNRSNEQVPSDAGYIWLNNCTNITINGCNLSNNLQGILLLFANNASIINNNITDNAYGIYVGIYSSNNTISGNTLKDNLNGIYLGEISRFTTMRNNSISDSQINFGVPPNMPRLMDRSDLINNVDTSNTVNGKPIVYWINQHHRRVTTNAGYILLINCTNILIEGLNLSNNIQNIFLLASNNTVIKNNSITNSIYGIDVRGYSLFDYNTRILHRFYSFNTTVTGNMLVDNAVGMRFQSDNSTISNNTIHSNPLGIYLMGTSNSTISRNMVIASDRNVIPPSPPPGLCIFYYPQWPWEYSVELARFEIGGIIVGGAHNTVYGNTVRDSFVGISTYDFLRMYIGYRNVIFNNNLINNTRFQAFDYRGYNYWDNGYPWGGNYWSDYTGVDFYGGPYQNETGSDGIGDTPYIIRENNQDNYPLMEPWSPTPPVVESTVNVNPQALNLRSRGRWITAYIELSEGYDVADINVTTILLNDAVPAEPRPVAIGDYDNDTIPDLMVKFNRAEVISYIPANVDMTQLIEKRFMTVTLTITGCLNDGTPFQGSDTIRIIMPMPRCSPRVWRFIKTLEIFPV